MSRLKVGNYDLYYGPINLSYKQKVVATEIKDAKPTSKDSEELSEEAEMKLAKTKRSETVEETILEHENIKSEDSKEGSDEENAIGDNSKIERSKGGGEHCARIYQEFMRARERGSLTNLMESPMHT